MARPKTDYSANNSADAASMGRGGCGLPSNVKEALEKEETNNYE